MKSLYRKELGSCFDMCPYQSDELCQSLCAKAATINAYNERGKLFNVPFRAPPIRDLDTGTSDQEAWAALGQRAFSRMPWSPASQNLGAFAAAGPPPLPDMVQAPVDCPVSSALAGTFYGWNQVPDGLWQRTFVPSTDQIFSRAVDLNQAMSGYLLDPVAQIVQDGPLSALKPTAGNFAGQLPQADPFAGIGFNLADNVPRSGVANVRGIPTLFEPAQQNGPRSFRLANLAA